MADKITTIITPYLLRPPRLEIYQGNTLPMHDRPAKDLRPLQFIPFPVSPPFGPVPYYLRASIGVAVSIARLPL